MPDYFFVDTNREKQRDVLQVIASGDKDREHGGQTIRIINEEAGMVAKIGRKKSSMSLDATKKNLEMLEDARINYAGTTMGIYDLSKFNLGEKPVILQEVADMDFRDTLDEGHSTRKTYRLFQKAVKQVDKAVENNLLLDASLANFGFFRQKVAYLDVQDSNSVRKLSNKEELVSMYKTLENSVLQRSNGKERSDIRPITREASKIDL